MNTHKLVKPYLIESGRHFQLKDHDPADTYDLKPSEKEEATVWLQAGVTRLSEMQDLLNADASWGMLLIFQGLDAAGKDGTIKHVMSGVNPQGVDVYSFKTPSAEETSHDFLWRTNRCLPPHGKIAVFNRSYYEEVLIVRVHPDFLDRQHIPKSARGKELWQQRYQDISNAEAYLFHNRIIVRKFFLNISKKEQKRRLLARLDDYRKNWKFSAADIEERKYWDDYQHAYEKMIRNTSSDYAPWIVVPADNKWFARLLVVATINDTLERLNLSYPKITPSQHTELKAARKKLLKD
jgi:PPK2 family polyphosphate:nucleotide phosphotransferase